VYTPADLTQCVAYSACHGNAFLYFAGQVMGIFVTVQPAPLQDIRCISNFTAKKSLQNSGCRWMQIHKTLSQDTKERAMVR